LKSYRNVEDEKLSQMLQLRQCHEGVIQKKKEPYTSILRARPR